MSEETKTPQAKIAAAREAIEKAAALLLEHAEGLAILAMAARRYEPLEPHEPLAGHAPLDYSPLYGMAAGPTPTAITIRNEPAERAFCEATIAAAELAGLFQAFTAAREWPSRYLATLREEVEKLVGPDGGMPPPLERMPQSAGDPDLKITPDQVHSQAWRSHLASTTSPRIRRFT